MVFTAANTREGYTRQIAAADIKPNWRGAYERAASYIIANRAKYEEVERMMDIPWALVGCLHWREASGSFAGVLHNGEKILGTGRKTRLEPRGRGPFATWSEAAADAIKIKQKQRPPAWDLEGVAWFSETFNGLGYKNIGVVSPYLWAGTTIYTGGKFYADHKYSSKIVDKQLGVMPLYQLILEKTEVRAMSRKIWVIDKVKTTMKAVTGVVGGWFTADNLGLIGQVHSGLTGVVAAQTVIALIAAGVAFWLILNVLDRMIMEDHEEGRWTPSGQEAKDVGPA